MAQADSAWRHEHSLPPSLIRGTDPYPVMLEYADFSDIIAGRLHPLLLATADRLAVLGTDSPIRPCIMLTLWYWKPQLIASRMGHMCILGL